MPIQALEEGLYSHLSTGTALTGELGGTFIYNKLAPPTPNDDYVIFQLQSGGDNNDNPTRSRNMLYLIKAISPDLDKSQDVDTIIDARINSSDFTVSGYNTFWTYRETDISFVEIDSTGKPIYHTGAIYRIQIEES